MLTVEQLQGWRRDGYLVLPGFKPEAELQALRERAAAIVDAFEPGAATGCFSTRDRSLLHDAALLASAHEVHCFFEEEALTGSGALRVPKAASVNKIGHALHVRDPVFGAFSRGPALAALAQDLGLQHPQVWQSQLIFKQAHIGGEVGWHQDASFFVTDPLTVTTFWFAVDDATLDNGCLWVEPGGHRGPLRERYVNDHGRLRMEALDATPWPSARKALPVPAGTLVLFHGLLPHRSEANRSPQPRRAYTLHVTDGRARYAASNWLQAGAGVPAPGFGAPSPQAGGTLP
jgi:phytanoyl-CoA hydroxylase